MGAARTILRNIASNSAGYVVNVVVALLLTPFVYRQLGMEAYGIWNLIISLTGYYGLLDLGIRSAVGYFVAVHWARKEMDRVNETMNTAMVLLALACTLCFLVTLAIIFLFPRWEPEAVERDPDILWAILVMGVGFGLSFPMAVYSTVIYARQRLDIQNAVGISQRLLSAGLVVVMLKAGYGVLGMAIAVMGTNVLAWAANIHIAHRLMPDLKLKRRFSRRAFRGLRSYGFFNFIVNAADNILIYTDAIVIKLFLPLVAISYYSVAANLIPYYMSIVQAVTWAFTPYASARYATGDFAALRKLMIVGTRGTLMLATLLGGGLFLLGFDFLQVWINDPRLLSGEAYTSSAVILAILTTATLIRATQSVGRQILFSIQEVKFLGLLAFAEAAGNLVFSLILIQYFGIAGVAFGSLIPIVITQGFLQPLYVMNKLGLPPGQFFWTVIRAVVPTMLAMDAAYFLYARTLPCTHWGEFLIKATVVGVPGVIAGISFGLGAEERNALSARLGLKRKPKVQPPGSTVTGT